MDREKAIDKNGVKEFIAKYGATSIAALRLTYDVAMGWVGRH